MSTSYAESAVKFGMRKVIALSMVGIFSIGAIADTPITTTIDGVEWRFRIDPETQTAMIGHCTTPNPSDKRNDAYFACSSNTVMNASDIPWRFDYEGIQYTVTRIGASAFCDHRKFTGILTIPDTVKEVLGCAFYLCTGLTGLRGCDSVTNFQNSVFQACSGMTGTVPDLSSVVVFGERVFEGAKLTGDLKLGASLTEIPGWAFRGSYWDEVIVPANVTTVGISDPYYGVFQQCRNMKALWVKGKPTVENQKYTTVYCGRIAQDCTSLKMVLMGQNTKGSGIRQTEEDFTMLSGDKGVDVLVPANGYWDGLVTGGEDNKVWYYGPTNEFDLVIDEAKMSATFTPTTENALTNVIAWAPLLKEHFDLDTVISITNHIDSSFELSDAMLQNVTISAKLWFLTFNVQSQAQLDNVLAAVSVDTPVLIDIEGAGRNQITVPEGRQVAILAKGGWTFGEKPRGIVVTFR